MVTLIIFLVVFIGLLYIDWHFFLKKRCKHELTRCIHGDEINDRAPIFGQARRQSCLICGRALKRPPICSFAGLRRHDWTGVWPEEWNWESDITFKQH